MLIAEIIDDSLGSRSGLIEQLQISGIGDDRWGAGGVDGECSPILAYRPVSWLHEIVDGDLSSSICAWIVGDVVVLQ